MAQHHAAARHLLAQSHLQVDLDGYWRDDTGDYDWERLRKERAYSGSESAIIGLAESMVDGALSHGSLDNHNFTVLVESIYIAYGRDLP